MKTNSKCLPLEERIPRIQCFHTWLIYGLQSSGEQRCAKYGRFPSPHMFYADQIPLPFVYGKLRSLNPVGMECWLARPGNGLEDVADIDRGVMYGLDNLGAHRNIDIKTKLVDADIYPVSILSQCTDVIAPVDHHIGQWAKEAMAVLFEHELERSREA